MPSREPNGRRGTKPAFAHSCNCSGDLCEAQTAGYLRSSGAMWMTASQGSDGVSQSGRWVSHVPTGVSHMTLQRSPAEHRSRIGQHNGMESPRNASYDQDRQPWIPRCSGCDPSGLSFPTQLTGSALMTPAEELIRAINNLSTKLDQTKPIQANQGAFLNSADGQAFWSRPSHGIAGSNTRTDLVLKRLRQGLIGHSFEVLTPFGSRTMLYADWAASGRLLWQVLPHLTYVNE